MEDLVISDDPAPMFEGKWRDYHLIDRARKVYAVGSCEKPFRGSVRGQWQREGTGWKSTEEILLEDIVALYYKGSPHETEINSR